MKLILTGGGTAGHIYPAIALANALVAQGHEVLFIGTKEGLESELIPEAGFEFQSVKAAGFDRARPWTLLSSGIEVLSSSGTAKQMLKAASADLVIGFGGYVSIPVCLAARRLKLPLVLHEQNSVPGLANKILSQFASLIMISYEGSKDYFAPEVASKIRVTGNPVREKVKLANREQARTALGLGSDDILLLVFGGSRGARTLNEAFVGVSPELLSNEKLRIIHVAGEALFNETSELLLKAGISVAQHDELSFAEGETYLLRSYLHNLFEIMAAADVVVSRAGATTLAELSVLHKASLLVPYPFATDDHQTKNAEYFVSQNAARMLSDEELSGDGGALLKKELLALISDAEMRESLAENMAALSRVDADLEMVHSIYSIGII